LKYLETSNCNCNLTSSLDDVMTLCLFKQQNNRSSNLYKCSFDFTYSFFDKNNNDCYDYCPLECKSSKYIMNYNIERYPVTGNITTGEYEFFINFFSKLFNFNS